MSDGGEFESAGNMKNSGENEAMGDVFAGGTVIPGPEGIQRIAHAVHVVKEFAEQGIPMFSHFESV